MKPFSIQSMVIILFLYVSLSLGLTQAGTTKVKRQHLTCYNRRSKCFLKYVTCPVECPNVKPSDPNAKGCFLDCYSPKCEAVCRKRKPNCNGPGSACFDPRFIGGDGVVFYFHGTSNAHFNLISDINLQINAHFIGLRPTTRTRDYTWIQALGLMFGSKNFTLEATKSEKWTDEIDHLQFSYNGQGLIIPEIHSSKWNSSDGNFKVERISSKNSVIVAISDVVEIFVNVVPVTQQDSKIHNYQIPYDNCFAHLEVQFRLFDVSPKVDGVLGRTYRPDFKNLAKPGVAMAVVGGEDKYRTSSLLSADCESCVFSGGGVVGGDGLSVVEDGTPDCTSGGGNGMICRK